MCYLSLTLFSIWAYASLAQGRFDEAIGWSDAGHQLAKSVDARRLELITRANIAWAYYKLGDSEKALASLTESKELASQLGDVWTEQNELTNIGYVYMDERSMTSPNNHSYRP